MPGLPTLNPTLTENILSLKKIKLNANILSLLDMVVVDEELKRTIHRIYNPNFLSWKQISDAEGTVLRHNAVGTFWQLSLSWLNHVAIIIEQNRIWDASRKTSASADNSAARPLGVLQPHGARNKLQHWDEMAKLDRCPV